MIQCNAMTDEQYRTLMAHLAHITYHKAKKRAELCP